MDLAEKGQHFLDLHRRPEILVLPNPWDIGSARLLQHLGFEALATTSAGFSHSRGLPDGGATRDDSLAHAREIASSVALPVSADLESCFADDPEGVAATIMIATGCGIVGCSIEDATGDLDNPIYEFRLAVERVAAAAEVAAGAGFPFTLTARSENFLHGRPDVEDTVNRLMAFADAGADVVYAPGIAEPSILRTIVEKVPVPVNVLAMPSLTVQMLEDLGVARVSVGSGLSRAAFSALFAGATELIEKGTFGYGWEERPPVDLNGIFDET